MSSAAARQVVRAPVSLLIFPDEILEEIFLRLDAAADVARASAACTTFRRVVSARRFRRRLRTLHPPPILGFLETHAPGAFHPAEPPHGSAPAARALAQAADFTFSFIDAPGTWKACDARDGRVLLYARPNAAASADLIVCDPLHRRREIRGFDAFLDPATDKDEKESFRVICAVQCRLSRLKLVTFHFSSVTGKWRLVTFDGKKPLNDLISRCAGMYTRRYAHGCFYWTYPRFESLVILDPREMKLSVVNHSPNYKVRAIVEQGAQAIVELVNGSLGFVSLVDDDTLELYSKTLRNNAVDTEVWQYDKRIPLPKMDMPCRCWSIKDAADGCLLLQATQWVSHRREFHYFTLDLETFLFKKLCMSSRNISYAQLYASFPPPLSLPKP
ncbi:hypothetical protein U9M48_037430 [Paspalum notatum var. saurae]|uniref:F-box domain-containing protein n=1 Tax=Paspalum notatum var. saurae TaxID=547442 RepID=A0AAQ3UEW3_PASNO